MSDAELIRAAERAGDATTVRSSTTGRAAWLKLAQPQFAATMLPSEKQDALAEALEQLRDEEIGSLAGKATQDPKLFDAILAGSIKELPTDVFDHLVLGLQALKSPKVGEAVSVHKKTTLTTKIEAVTADAVPFIGSVDAIQLSQTMVDRLKDPHLMLATPDLVVKFVQLTADVTSRHWWRAAKELLPNQQLKFVNVPAAVAVAASKDLYGFLAHCYVLVLADSGKLSSEKRQQIWATLTMDAVQRHAAQAAEVGAKAARALRKDSVSSSDSEREHKKTRRREGNSTLRRHQSRDKRRHSKDKIKVQSRKATSKTECFRCHKLGHFSWDCKDKK